MRKNLISISTQYALNGLNGLCRENIIYLRPFMVRKTKVAQATPILYYLNNSSVFLTHTQSLSLSLSLSFSLSHLCVVVVVVLVIGHGIELLWNTRVRVLEESHLQKRKKTVGGRYVV